MSADISDGRGYWGSPYKVNLETNANRLIKMDSTDWELVEQNLHKVRELLDEEVKWTKRSLARDSQGMYVPPASVDAVCWCLTGAVEKVTVGGQPWVDAILHLHDTLQKLTLFTPNVAVWNDIGPLGYQGVIQLLDEAIDDAQEKTLHGLP